MHEQRADIPVVDLGRMAYRPAYQVQSAAVEEIVASREGPAPLLGRILLVEHDPVITVSARPSAGRHVVATATDLAAAGVAVEETDRGGDVTYHGPGQLVVYPIIDLNAFGLRLHDYMRLLEQAVIDTCSRFGVAAGRDVCATGVWVGATPRSANGDASNGACSGGSGGRKICALGVRVRRWVSMHGLALNVTTNLDHFKLIVPCGLVGRSVTSLQRELRGACPAMAEVKTSLVDRLRDRLLERLKHKAEAASQAGPHARV